MRSFLIILSLIIISILSIPLYLMEFVIRAFNPRLSHKIAQKIVVGVFRMWLWFSGTEYTVYGLENVPKDEPVLYIANHRSFFDIFLGYAYVPTLTSFVSKKSIGNIPCIAQWMYFLSCLFLDRDDIKSGLAMIKRAISLVENEGYSIFISPEGTRNNTDELLPFKEGSFKIATRTNCKIVPVCYTNTEKIFEDHIPWVRKTRSVTMEFGKPIDISRMDRDAKKHLGVTVRGIIQDMYNERRH
mgnify:CR=1 FL=1